MSRSLWAALRPFIVAFQFLTVLPVPDALLRVPPPLSASLVYFPLVGAGLGGLLAFADHLLRLWIPTLPASAIVIALLALVTGALHLDGLADTCDGLLSPGRSRAERLEIMRDSGLGAFGFLGLLLVLAVQVSSLAMVPPSARAGVLVTALALGRWAIVYSYAAYPYARQDAGPSASLKAGASPRVLVLGTSAAVLASLTAGLHGLLIALIVGAATLVLVRKMAECVGGITGDLCGAACEASQTLTFVVAASLTWRVG
jgi:adenosylcobinamide-GDP ribazoletransferase